MGMKYGMWMLGLGALVVVPNGIVCAQSDPFRSPIPAVRRQAVRGVTGGRDKDVRAVLLRLVEDPDPTVRAAVVRAFGRLHDRRAVPVLVARLTDMDANVRFYAADSLGQLADAAAADGLLQALGDSQWTVRNQAAWALSRIGGQKTARQLCAALEQGSVDEPLVTWALRQIGSAATQEPLIALLGATKATTRQRALRMLRDLKIKSAVPAMVGRLHDDDPTTRITAAGALARMRASSAIRDLQSAVAGEADERVKAALRTALVQLTRREDLLAYWSFDKDSDQVVHDVTGRGNDGRLQRGVYVPGKSGMALQLSGTGLVECGQPVNLPFANGPLTVMAWIKTDHPNGVVIVKGGKAMGFSLFVTDGHAAFGIRRAQEEEAFIAKSDAKVTGRWVHLAGVITEDHVAIFVDGKSAGQTKTTGYIPGTGGQGLEMGYDVGNSPADFMAQFEGLIDEVKIIRAALSEVEIQNQMTSTDLSTNSP